MLSDEEKKAIERIDYIQDFIIENGQYNADVNDMQYFSKVLNVIKKQSKEIEELIQRNKDLEQIEKEHKEENGRLRDRIKELEIEKENEFKRGFFTKVNESHKHTIKIESQVIPIFKIEKKIEELTKIKGDLATYIATSERIKVLQELLEESDK